MKKYIRIMRIDHWIKQFFIFPGIVFGIVLLNEPITAGLACRVLAGFIATSLIASANYVINEWLDAEFDKYHPVKKHRSVVENDMDGRIVYALYAALTVLGLVLGWRLGRAFFIVLLWLWVMGVLYNVKPVRTKDIPYVDVLTESVNNAIRLLLGWYLVTAQYFPPVSVVVGYWFAGAFLMGTKRFSEYRMIGDPEQAGLYRKSFQHYSEVNLLISSFFYAMTSVLFIGIFLTKYRIELILFMPVFIGLFCYYFFIAFKEDSAAQRPEKLFRERGLMLYVGGLILLFLILMKWDVEGLSRFMSNELLPMW